MRDNFNINSKLRDYDINPLVIKDYSRLFPFVFNMICYIFCVILAIYFMIEKHNLGMYIGGTHVIIGCLIFGGIELFKFNKFYCNPNFKFILSNNKILETKNSEIIIDLDKSEVGLTYIAMDDKNAKYNKESFIIGWFLVFPANILFIQPVLIISKILFHLINSGEFMLFDSFIVVDDNGKFINIMANNKKEFAELKQYFWQTLKINKFEPTLFFHYTYQFHKEYGDL